MNKVRIPLSQYPRYSFAITLFGTAYNFNFYWVDNGGFWCFDLLDSNSTVLVSGIKMVFGYDMLEQYPINGRLFLFGDESELRPSYERIEEYELVYYE